MLKLIDKIIHVGVPGFQKGIQMFLFHVDQKVPAHVRWSDMPALKSKPMDVVILLLSQHKRNKTRAVNAFAEF